jgi:cysteine desulfurase/selenocysteine lyase
MKGNLEKLIFEITEKKIFNIESIRKDFPILHRKVYGKPLVYFDNAATTQKPYPVIETVNSFYSNVNSNIHRGVHYLSDSATGEYECARRIVQKFINARFDNEIIYTRGTTESINLIASSYGRNFLKKDDEIIISYIEHHSNIVPWQILCEQIGCVLKVIPMNDKGELLLEEFDKLISEKTKLVSVVHISNSLGTINDIEYIFNKARSVGAVTLLDAAQSIQHVKIDVQKLDCDFLAFSGHKIYAPTGIGVLYGKQELLEKMPPYQGGGDMIRTVSFEKTTYNDLPYKFEAGTPNIAGSIGLGSAIRYLQTIGFDEISKHENELLKYATEKVQDIKGLRIIGTANNKSSVLSFVLDNAHPHDVGTLLDRDGIAIRTGQHCTEPVMKRLGIPATSRASFAFYNTKEEIDIFVDSIKKVINMFS